MSNFWGASFVYAGIPSETYDLYINTSETTANNSVGILSTNPGDITIYSQAIYRRPVPFFWGTQQSAVLEFDVTFNSLTELTAEDAHLISRWLFGKQNFAKLQIMQYDLQDIYFNAFLTKPQTLYVGNTIRGFQAHVTCDAPWAWCFPKTTTYTYTTPNVNVTTIINNTSDNNFYTYPSMVITVGAFSNATINIINTTDNSRLFSFTGMSAGEVLTVNNDLQIITSSTGLLRLSNFNKHWFRLLQGVNSVNIQGEVASVSFTYSPARKVGG